MKKKITHEHDWSFQIHSFADNAELVFVRRQCACGATTVGCPSWRPANARERKFLQAFDAQQETHHSPTYDEVTDAYCRGYTSGYESASAHINREVREAQARARLRAGRHE